MSVCLPFVGFWPPSLPPACALLWEAQPAAKRALGAPLRLMPASACGARLCTAGGRRREAPKVTQSEVGSRALSPPVMPFRLGPEQGTTTELVWGGKGEKKEAPKCLRDFPRFWSPDFGQLFCYQILFLYSGLSGKPSIWNREIPQRYPHRSLTPVSILATAAVLVAFEVIKNLDVRSFCLAWCCRVTRPAGPLSAKVQPHAHRPCHVRTCVGLHSEVLLCNPSAKGPKRFCTTANNS